jgi:hypothetical protein
VTDETVIPLGDAGTAPVTIPLRSTGLPLPELLVAINWKLYVVPEVSPVIVVLVFVIVLLAVVHDADPLT